MAWCRRSNTGIFQTYCSPTQTLFRSPKSSSLAFDSAVKQYDKMIIRKAQRQKQYGTINGQQDPIVAHDQLHRYLQNHPRLPDYENHGLIFSFLPEQLLGYFVQCGTPMTKLTTMTFVCFIIGA